jgi:hypothetical protein
MFEFRSLFIIYFMLVAMATVLIYHAYINMPIVRGRIESDWVMEGFRGSEEKTAAVIAESPDPEMVAGKYVDILPGEGVKRDGTPYTLLTDSDCVKVVDRVAAADKGPWSEGVAGNEPNSEDCYRHNSQACMNSRGGSYAQVTNNYMRLNPDSCSSPFHEFLGNFYKNA